MNCDFLDRYLWEAQAHANELLDLYGELQREAYEDRVHQMWNDILPHLLDPPKTAYVFLGEGPTPRERRLAAMPPGEGFLLWLQARHLALQATIAIELARDVAGVKGMSYRKAVRHAAQAASRFPAPPTPEALLWLRLPD